MNPQTPTNPPNLEAWIFLAVSIVILIAGVLILFLFQEIRKQPKKASSSRLTKPSQRINIKVNSGYGLHPKYPYLVSLLQGDRAAADRLASSVGVEKAIEDLIRDRM